jgi:hypothetical protein
MQLICCRPIARTRRRRAPHTFFSRLSVAEAAPEAGWILPARLRKLVAERRLPVPPPNRTIDSIRTSISLERISK